MKEQLVAAVDYETFYDSKGGYSMRNMTTWQYVHDPRFNAYVVSIAFSDGRPVYTGRPGDFDWRSLFDEGALLIAHNAAFDSVVTLRLMELGVIPELDFRWSDTADMVAYLGVRRSLQSAMKYLLDREISKQVREDMDGRLPEDLDPKTYDDLMRYVSSDAEECLELWMKFSDRWPEVERRISEQNRLSCIRGFRVDRALVEEGIETLRRIQNHASDQLPWTTCEDPSERLPAGSRVALIREVKRLGLEPPSTFKKDAPEFLEWQERNADKCPFLKARLEHAGTVQHIARLETLRYQLDENDLVRPGFIYFGAHSGRFAAGLGEEQRGAKNVNMLNLPRKPVFGVDMRAMYIPRPGYKFVIFDYSQIEARASLWLSGDDEFCRMLDDPKANLYGITAAKMGWCKMGEDIKHEKPDLYRLAKCCVLGLGYSMGANKFVDSCKSQGLVMPSLPKSEWPELGRREMFMLRNVCKLDPKLKRDEEAIGRFFYSERVVGQWRQANSKIVVMWHRLQDIFAAHAQARDEFVSFTLPSGREKTYFWPHLTKEVSIVVDPTTGKKENRTRDILTANVVKGQPPKFFTGGKLMENLIQSLCRDIMTYGAVEIEEKHPSWKFLWSCYDEVVFEVPEGEVPEALAEMPKIMCHGERIRDWTRGLPLAVDGGAFDHYCK